MSHGSVPRPPTVVLMIPRNRMQRAHAPARISGLVKGEEYPDLWGKGGTEVVPLIVARPGGGQGLRRSVGGVHHVDGSRLYGGMVGKIRPDELPVPRPVILGIGGRVDTHKAPPLPDKLLKRCLLVEIENIPGRTEKNHHAIPCQGFWRKYGRVFTDLDPKMVLDSQGLQRRNPDRTSVARSGARPASGTRPSGACGSGTCSPS